jgi:hypothetical protein
MRCGVTATCKKCYIAAAAVRRSRGERERAKKHKKLQLRKSIKYIKMKNECLFYAKFPIFMSFSTFR